MRFMRYRREFMVAGINAQMRRLLGASIVPARQVRARDLDEVVSQYTKEDPLKCDSEDLRDPSLRSS